MHSINNANISAIFVRKFGVASIVRLDKYWSSIWLHSFIGLRGIFIRRWRSVVWMDFAAGLSAHAECGAIKWHYLTLHFDGAKMYVIYWTHKSQTLKSQYKCFSFGLDNLIFIDLMMRMEFLFFSRRGGREIFHDWTAGGHGVGMNIWIVE